MNILSNRTVALIALLLLAAKANAQSTDAAQDDKVTTAISKIQLVTQNNPDLLTKYLLLTKAQLEDALKVALTDNEFGAIQGLVARLRDEGVTFSWFPSIARFCQPRKYMADNFEESMENYFNNILRNRRYIGIGKCVCPK